MVLAAGLGTRLWPLTDEVAKPAVPFLGRPLVEWVVELLGKHGIEHAVVNTHHKAQSVTRALPEPIMHGVRVTFSHEPEILGTAGALERALETGLLFRDRPVLVINAKLFTDYDLSALLEEHRRSGAQVTMGLRPNSAREAFREVLVDDGWVTGFGDGRVPKGSEPLLFTGIHVLEPDVVASIAPGLSDTIADVYPPLIATRQVRGHVDARGRWWELSTLNRYLELHVRAVQEGLWTSPNGVVASAGAWVDPAARVVRSVLWEGARIEPGAEVIDSIIGRGVRIASGRRVQHEVVVKVSNERPERGRVEDGLLFASIGA